MQCPWEGHVWWKCRSSTSAPNCGGLAWRCMVILVLSFPGDKYEGEWKFGRANGRGTFSGIDGEVWFLWRLPRTVCWPCPLWRFRPQSTLFGNWKRKTLKSGKWIPQVTMLGAEWTNWCQRFRFFFRCEFLGFELFLDGVGVNSFIKVYKADRNFPGQAPSETLLKFQIFWYNLFLEKFILRSFCIDFETENSGNTHLPFLITKHSIESPEIFDLKCKINSHSCSSYGKKQCFKSN